MSAIDYLLRDRDTPASYADDPDTEKRADARAELRRLRAIEARYKADVEKAYREGWESGEGCVDKNGETFGTADEDWADSTARAEMEGR